MAAILVDYHHSDLFESLQLVFVDRFGWELYRPIGLEWFEEGYWRFGHEHSGDSLAAQFLAPWPVDRNAEDYWVRPDTTHPGRSCRMVTLEQARARRWDFVLSSVPDNDDGFNRFAREIGAKWVTHVGNEGQPIRWDLDPLAIITAQVEISDPSRAVVVHQEFSLRDFTYEPPSHRDIIASFVPCFAATAPYALFRELAQSTPDFRWRVYGGYGDAPVDALSSGVIETTPGIGRAMRDAGFIWHTKLADGFGHVVHNAFACGRPVVGSMSCYHGKIAEPLWIDGVTCINTDQRSPDELRETLRRIRDCPEEHLAMCEAAARRFREVVDFDADAERIRRLLE